MTDEIGRKQAERDLARHEAGHPGCNEPYWMERAERAEARVRQLELEALDHGLDAINLAQQHSQELSQYLQMFSELKADYEKMRDRWQVANLTITVGQIDGVALKAAAHFYRCGLCRGGSPCEEGERYARALGLIYEK